MLEGLPGPLDFLEDLACRLWPEQRLGIFVVRLDAVLGAALPGWCRRIIGAAVTTWPSWQREAEASHRWPPGLRPGSSGGFPCSAMHFVRWRGLEGSPVGAA